MGKQNVQAKEVYYPQFTKIKSIGRIKKNWKGL